MVHTLTNRYQALIPWIIATAAAVMRLYHLTTNRLWYDESFTLLVTMRPFTDAIRATMFDVHPPLYYVITWCMVRVFSWLPAPLVLRGLSVILSLVGLWVFWRLTAGTDLPRPARLAALAFLAFSPVVLYFSQEARMYALLQLLVMLQLLAVIQRRWLLLLITTTAALYTHNYGLFYSAAIGLLALARERNWRPVLALGLAGAAWLPWAWVLAGQMGAVQASYWIQPVTPGSLIMAMLRGWVGVHTPEVGSVAVVLVLLPLLTLLATHAIYQRRFGLLWMALAPLAMAVCVSLAWKPVLLYRGLYGSLPALAMLAGGAFTSAHDAGKVGRWLLVAPIALALAWQLAAVQVNGVDHTGSPWPDPKSATLYHLEDTSLIEYSANWPGVRSVLIEAGCPFKAGELTTQTRAALGIETIAIDNLPPDYEVVALVGPLSTACHEAVYHQLTDQARPLWQRSTAFGVYGMWDYEKN